MRYPAIAFLGSSARHRYPQLTTMVLLVGCINLAIKFICCCLLAAWKKPLGWHLGLSLEEQVINQRCLHLKRK